MSKGNHQNKLLPEVAGRKERKKQRQKERMTQQDRMREREKLLQHLKRRRLPSIFHKPQTTPNIRHQQ